jgi:Cytosolic domain of 10TM putative phosphate transporter
MRARSLDVASKDAPSSGVGKTDTLYHPHPHPQYRFTDVPIPDRGYPNKGLRLRTIMVSNVPHSLRNEQDLKEYFKYYMCRKLEKPSMGITSSTQPGFFNKTLAFLFIRAKRIPAHLPPVPLLPHSDEPSGSPDVEGDAPNLATSMDPAPTIDRVVIVRKMTELASLLERREEILRLLETAHIKLANKTLAAVKAAMDRKAAHRPFSLGKTRAREVVKKARQSTVVDVEERGKFPESTLDEKASMEHLIEVLGPYVEEFGLQASLTLRYGEAISTTSRHFGEMLRIHGSTGSDAVRASSTTPVYPPSSSQSRHSHSRSIWEALHFLPRSRLDPYQPLVNLSHLFRGKVVPSIDYYTAKLNLLSSLITEKRAKASSDFDPVSTAFVTFADPADAKRACKYLAVHPNNPLACLVTMAPMYQDLDWKRVMKSSFNVDVSVSQFIPHARKLRY